MPEPLNPNAIALLPGVEHNFQTDRDFQVIHLSSGRAQHLLEISGKVLANASDMSERTGLGSIFRIQITAPDGRLILFSLNPQNEQSVGPRVFGFESDLTTEIDELAIAVNDLIAPTP